MIEGILNRWRGTGKIIAGINGNLIYAAYWIVLVGLLSQWYWGLLAGAVYIAGESFAWGKWVGYVSTADRNSTPLEECYKSDDGTRFPYIHYIANAVVKEKVDYLNYCRLALTIRGIIWWMPVLAVLAGAGLVAWWYVIVGGLLAGVGFVVAAEIGRLWNYELQSRWLNMSVGWENQEVVYGFIQFLVVTVPMLIGVVCSNG